MTDKVGFIKNPLTIIAIFAGIAEVSGTIVLPFVAENNQQLFIYFLIFFPSLLVVIFFITLNFNNKVLYAPSDYKDETNYIQINKFDVAKQKTVEVKVPKVEMGNQDLIIFRERVDDLSNHLIRLESSLIKTENSNGSTDIALDSHLYDFQIVNFKDAHQFIKKIKLRGIVFSIYSSPDYNANFDDKLDSEAIWLGEKVPLKILQIVLKGAKDFYPHLKYIKLLGLEPINDSEEIFIGGSTESATKYYSCLPLSSADFEKINSFTDLNECHRFIKSFSAVSGVIT